MTDSPLALVVGANRGLGLGLVREMLGKGWHVIATARRPNAATELAALAERNPGRVEIEQLDMADPAALDTFPARLDGRTLDVLFVNAGVSGPAHRSAQQATEAETGALMFINAVAPIRLARRMLGQVRPESGIVAFMSSRMGSVAENPGGHELYRASKAALNSLSRGLAAEAAAHKLTVLSLHPGWVRTDMGGPSAPVDVETSTRGLTEVLTASRGKQGHHFIDYTGAEIPW